MYARICKSSSGTHSWVILGDLKSSNFVLRLWRRQNHTRIGLPSSLGLPGNLHVGHLAANAPEIKAGESFRHVVVPVDILQISV